MLQDFLNEIVLMAAGKGVEPIAELLNSNKYQNEFNLAKKLGITINQTRNILYKLSDYGLVVSERKKDKKKGWYTYYWKFDIMKCLDFLKGNLFENKEKFNTQIKRRDNVQFYVCESCNLEYSEEEALLMEFTCDECGELLTTKDNATLVKALIKNIEKIDERLAEIEVEVEKEQKKLDKKKVISIKAEEEEKEKKKLEAKKRREERKKEKALLKPEKPKKKVKEIVKKENKIIQKKVIVKKKKKPVQENKVVKKKKTLEIGKKSSKKIVKKK